MEKKVIFTSAPREYDYWYTTQLSEDVGRTTNRQTIRKVETARSEGQAGRYFSGAIYMVADQGEFDKLVGYGLVTVPA